MDNKEIALPNSLTSAKPVFSEEQMQNFSEMMNSPEYQNYAANKVQEQIRESLGLNKPIQPPKNQMVEEQKKLNTDVEQLKLQLTSIQYENMKLNAQIEVMNKTIDSNNEELHKLQSANSDLKAVNQTLKDNNKHYWLFTALISIGCAILGVILGHYF